MRVANKTRDKLMHWLVKTEGMSLRTVGDIFNVSYVAVKDSVERHEKRSVKLSTDSPLQKKTKGVQLKTS